MSFCVCAWVFIFWGCMILCTHWALETRFLFLSWIARVHLFLVQHEMSISVHLCSCSYLLLFFFFWMMQFVNEYTKTAVVNILNSMLTLSISIHCTYCIYIQVKIHIIKLFLNGHDEKQNLEMVQLHIFSLFFFFPVVCAHKETSLAEWKSGKGSMTDVYFCCTNM